MWGLVGVSKNTRPAPVSSNIFNPPSSLPSRKWVGTPSSGNWLEMEFHGASVGVADANNTLASVGEEQRRLGSHARAEYPCCLRIFQCGQLFLQAEEGRIEA